jgi:hypothetical protein
MTEHQQQQAADAQQASEQDVEEEVETDHLDDMEDGCGCAEVWEHLSERREGAADDD